MIALHIKDFIWHILHINKSIQFKILSQHLANLRRLLLKRHNVRRHKITLQDRINIKNIYQKMLDCGKPSFSRKDELVFFIEKSLQSLAYRNQLINDKQEPDEIEEQMLVADDMISRKARLFMYQTFSKKFMLDSYSNDKRDEMFIKAIEYNLRYKKDFDPKEYVDLYFNIYGITKKLSRLILTAILENQPKLEKALTKYYKQ